MANNKDGVYVVGLGTQQFTVLAMHDRWVELTPRANLRRFPDMARGMVPLLVDEGVSGSSILPSNRSQLTPMRWVLL